MQYNNTLNMFMRIFYAKTMVSFRVQSALFLSQSCDEEMVDEGEEIAVRAGE